MNLELCEYANEFLRVTTIGSLTSASLITLEIPSRTGLVILFLNRLNMKKRLKEYESFPQYPSIFTLPLSYVIEEATQL